MTNKTIKEIILLAFEIGKWEGQVELEEHYDKEQYSEALLEQAYSRKMAMPISSASNGREVLIGLRSQQWRDGVRSSTKNYLKKN